MNQCLDYLRGRQAKMGRATDSLDAEGAAEPAAAGARSCRPQSAGWTSSGRSRRLPEGCRAAFLLHDVEGFEHSEVARILGVSEGTSKSQVAQGAHEAAAMLSA